LLTAPDLDDLVYWADITMVRSIRFAHRGAHEAPAIQLTLLIEASKDPALIPRLIGCGFGARCRYRRGTRRFTLFPAVVRGAPGVGRRKFVSAPSTSIR